MVGRLALSPACVCVGPSRACVATFARRSLCRQAPAQVAPRRATLAIQTAEHKITSSCRCAIRTLCPATSSSWLLCNPFLSRVCPGNHYRSDPVRVQSTAISLPPARPSFYVCVQHRFARAVHGARAAWRSSRLRLRLHLRSLANLSQETAQFGLHRRNSIICNCCSLRLMQRHACLGVAPARPVCLRAHDRFSPARRRRRSAFGVCADVRRLWFGVRPSASSALCRAR
jgi:hypothetical protein